MTETEWSDTDKAQWILENGTPEFVWIYERVDNIVYRRPSPPVDGQLPPWINKQREIAYVSDAESYTDENFKFRRHTGELND